MFVIPTERSTQWMGEIQENQQHCNVWVTAGLQLAKHHLNMLHAMSKSSVFFQTWTLPGPGQPLSLSKSPDSDPPRPSPQGSGVRGPG